MARKDTVVYPVATNQSLATSFTTSPTVVTTLDNVAYQVNVTTTDSIGAFKVQASVDYAIYLNSNQVINPGNWVDLPLSGSPIANAAPDTININLNQLPFVAVRMVYTPSTAGTGTATIYLAAKQIGG